MKNEIQPLKPLSCSVDEAGVKHTRFNAVELRQYLANTADKVLLVETDRGDTAPIVVGPLRACLGMNE